MSLSPLIQDVFSEANQVRSIDKSSVLNGHFGKELSIVPLVALKAHSLLNISEIGEGHKVCTEIQSAVLPGMSANEANSALKIWLTKSQDNLLSIVVPKPENTLHKEIPNALYIPQNGTFRLADYGEICEDGSVAGHYKVSADFPWHDNKGRIDPFILEEIAAQIITYAYSARIGIPARDTEDGELNPKFPLLTFKTSEVRYHTGKMPFIQDAPKMVLSGKILIDEKREAKVVYTLFVQYHANGRLPLISGEIVANKATIALMKRAIKS